MKHFTRLPRKDPNFSATPVRIRFLGEWYDAEIVHAQKDMIDLSFRPPARELPDGPAEEIEFQWNAATLRLRNVRCLAVMRSPQETIVEVSTQDPLSRSRLWNWAYDLLYLGRTEPAPEADEYADIPLRGHYSKEKSDERLQWLREATRQELSDIGSYRLDPQRLKGNIENFVGAIEIPIGLAGPLLFRGQHADGYVVAPFATTEGALVASACRGAKALSLSGGVRTFTIRQRMMRAPVFVTHSIADAHKLHRFIVDHREEIMAEVRMVSRRATLTSLQSYQIGNALHVRFLYETGDAAGQNMTTAATWKACQWILAQTQINLGIEIRQFLIESNMSGDKKVNFLSYVSGRGICVTVEAFLPEDVLQSVLKVSADELAAAAGTFVAGSLQAGMVGFNINIANTIAAIFAATGQDIACVHESAIGQLDLRKEKDGLYASLLLPSLIIGTVGGGTGLPSQQECLKIMACQGADKVFRLAEIIGGFCLALDLSTLSAITSGQFASAHEKLGRNHPEDGLQDKHLTKEFFNTTLQNIPQFAADAGLHVTQIESLSLDTQNSILSELSSTALRKKIGHFAYDVHWENPVNSGVRRIVIKAKPTDLEVMNLLNQMAQGCGSRLARVFELYKRDLGFRKCHIREMEIYRLENRQIRHYMPEVLYTWRDDEHEIFAIAMDFLSDVILKDTVMSIDQWQEPHIAQTLHDLARIHAVFWKQEEFFADKDWITPISREQMITMTPLWTEFMNHARTEFPALFPESRVASLQQIIDRIPEFTRTLDRSPKTLTHNDFNPRNICLQAHGKQYRLCAYDWELATWQVPQRDVCEFLAFVLPPQTPAAERERWVEVYRKALTTEVGEAISKGDFKQTYDAACMEFAVNRLQLYAMAHTFKDYQFLPRVLDSHYAYLETVLQRL